MKKSMLVLSMLFIVSIFQVENANASAGKYIYGAGYMVSDIGLYVLPAFSMTEFLGNKFLSSVHDNIENRGNSILLKGCAGYLALHLLRVYFKAKYDESRK
ncbi:MAG: hypothetical protein P4L22_04400 [Candidatus Babeliales bacterium]|nr:hypothetical protein [Candidatus Babeliales bacterium]